MRIAKFLILILVFLLLSACGPSTKTSILQKPSGATLDDQMNRLTSQIICNISQYTYIIADSATLSRAFLSASSD